MFRCNRESNPSLVVRHCCATYDGADYVAGLPGVRQVLSLTTGAHPRGGFTHSTNGRSAPDGPVRFGLRLGTDGLEQSPGNPTSCAAAEWRGIRGISAISSGNLHDCPDQRGALLRKTSLDGADVRCEDTSTEETGSERTGHVFTEERKLS